MIQGGASGGVGEPIFDGGAADSSLFFDGFESYTDQNSFFSVGGWSTAPGSFLSAVTPGFSGSKAAKVHWTTGDSFLAFDHNIGGAAQPRQTIITFMYKTSAGFTVDNVGKKYMIINLGDTDRITTGLSGMNGQGAWDLNISGLFNGTQDTFLPPDFQPFMPTESVGEHLTNGSWHRTTIRRTKSSVGHSADGSVEIWVDGQKTHNATGLLLGTADVFSIQPTSEWNNGSPATQDEFWDDMRVWVDN